MTQLRYEVATADCAPIIAELHAASWRSAYRPFFTPEYLAGPIEEERLQLWTKKLAPGEGEPPWALIAWEEQNPVAFVCVILDRDPDFGALLDNLHVLPELKGRGIGKALLRQAAKFVLDHRPRSKMHLWVFENNTDARAFYDKMDGKVIGSMDYKSPDGVPLVSVRYVWDELVHLCGEDG